MANIPNSSKYEKSKRSKSDFELGKPTEPASNSEPSQNRELNFRPGGDRSNDNTGAQFGSFGVVLIPLALFIVDYVIFRIGVGWMKYGRDAGVDGIFYVLGGAVLYLIGIPAAVIATIINALFGTTILPVYE